MRKSLVLLLLIVLCSVDTSAYAVDNEYYQKLRPACSQAQGIMRTFSNGCADQCGSEGGGCTAAVIEHCDCGEEKCWSEEKETCIGGRSAEDSLREILNN